MGTRSFLIGGAVALVASAHAAAQAPDGAQAAPGEHWGLLDQYCVECHNFEDWAGGVAFDAMSPDEIPHEAEIWEVAVRKLRGRLMPPAGEPQPEQGEIDGLVGWLETTLDASTERPVAGHVPIQRLNRIEYATAVKALLDVEIDPDTVLPTEVEVDGFDNIAAALSVSPSFLEQYIAAARRVADLAVGDRQAKTASVYFESPGGAQTEHTDGMPLGTRGGVVFPHVFPADGEYRFTILDLDIGLYPRAAETRHTLLLLLDGVEVYRADVGGPEDLAWVDREGEAARAGIMERFADIPVEVTAGPHDIGIAFIERSRVLSEAPIAPSMRGNFGAGLSRLPHVINGVEVLGPLEPTGLSQTRSRELLYVCEPAFADEERACAEEIVANLARRAFRRPIDESDLTTLMPFYEAGRANGGRFDDGFESVVTAVLASPDFLYRAITPPEDVADADVFPLDDLELASRLAFFLWSQGPDDELIDVAAAGELSRPEVMEAQVRRMLADPRAQVLVTDFALKWLNLDELEAVDPNGQAFPGFTDSLREDFEREIELFLTSVFLDDASVLDLIDAPYTFVNEALARHYGIQGVRGDQFRRVTLEDEARWGLLGKGAVLLRTSYGDRTSPVLRGAWVLEKIMGTPPAPPPPDVETDLTVPEGQKVTTIRARLEAHREDQSCNSCHGIIDPWGIALENFDVTGRWRDYDHAAEAAIDASETLPNGVAVDGVVDLREELMNQSDQIVQNLTEKLMMYGLARELEYYDMPQVRAIVRQAAVENYTLASIILGIVNSDAFRLQAQPEFAAAESTAHEG